MNMKIVFWKTISVNRSDVNKVGREIVAGYVPSSL